MSGFKYPDRTYGPKFNAFNNQGDRSNEPSGLRPKNVNKPIKFNNMQSLNYYTPTIITRDYQREAPPNIIERYTNDS